MSRSRRPLTASAAAALAVSLSGCSLLATEEKQESGPTVDISAELPATFSQQGRWDMQLATDTRPVEMPEGIAVLIPGRTDSSLYRVAVVSPDDGSFRWVSDDFENPTPEEVPRLYATTVDGEPWVVVKTLDSANEMRLDMYSPAGTGDRRTPDSSKTFTGTGTKSLPWVGVGAEGIRVAKSKDSDGVFDPETGTTAPYEGPGDLSSVWAEGMVVTGLGESSGFGYAVDEESAWKSGSSRPAGTARDSSGKLLDAGPGILLAQWTSEDGGPMLAVHETRTGKVLAVQKDVPDQALEDSADSSLVQSADGKWAVYGQFLFGLKGGPSSVVDLHGGDVRAIYQDVLYIEGADDPLTARAAVDTASSAEASKGAADSESASPEESGSEVPEGSAEESASAEEADGGVEESSGESSEEEASYNGMVDAVTGDPLTNVEPDAVPLFVSNSSQGVFVLSSDGTTRLYSTPLS